MRAAVARECSSSPLTAEGVQEAAPRLLALLLASEAWQQLVAGVRREVRGAAARAAEQLLAGERAAVASGGSGLGSSWQQGGFTFLQPEQLAQLERQLGGGEGDSGRLAALHSLLAAQLVDLVGGAAWPRLLAHLQKAVGDPELEVARLGLAIHARLLVSGSHLAVKESFISLVDTVTSWYQERRQHGLLPSCGLSAASPLHCSLLSSLGLLASTARDLPRLWLRFPHR